eukprot:TRINITY_DN773029_c0_g1_i1.p1 TRINITY_DN773029_c0_g1~~TRINITY_DN773029_c0_g1_i1.p1  ORF type:complete len:558 (+),score=181.27 TRINITY_DN773029_c0_g1_i1:159-1832(+)
MNPITSEPTPCPQGYVRKLLACENCYKSKTKCVYSSPHGNCERCLQLNIPCKPRYRNQRKTSSTKQLRMPRIKREEFCLSWSAFEEAFAILEGMESACNDIFQRPDGKNTLHRFCKTYWCSGQSDKVSAIMTFARARGLRLMPNELSTGFIKKQSVDEFPMDVPRGVEMQDTSIGIYMDVDFSNEISCFSCHNLSRYDMELEKMLRPGFTLTDLLSKLCNDANAKLEFIRDVGTKFAALLTGMAPNGLSTSGIMDCELHYGRMDKCRVEHAFSEDSFGLNHFKTWLIITPLEYTEFVPPQLPPMTRIIQRGEGSQGEAIVGSATQNGTVQHMLPPNQHGTGVPEIPPLPSNFPIFQQPMQIPQSMQGLQSAMPPPQMPPPPNVSHDGVPGVPVAFNSQTFAHQFPQGIPAPPMNRVSPQSEIDDYMKNTPSLPIHATNEEVPMPVVPGTVQNVTQMQTVQPQEQQQIEHSQLPTQEQPQLPTQEQLQSQPPQDQLLPSLPVAAESSEMLTEEGNEQEAEESKSDPIGNILQASLQVPTQATRKQPPRKTKKRRAGDP